ncbi:MAG: DUF4012 domain-containing protein [Nocardioides sp.]
MSTPPTSDPVSPPSEHTRQSTAPETRWQTRWQTRWRISVPERLRIGERTHGAHRRRTQPRRIVLGVLAALAALLLLLTLDGIWAGRAMLRGVSDARSALTEGAVAAVTGDPDASIPHFADAAEAAEAALAAGDHPSMALLERVPWLGDNVRAVSAVAEASARTADAGLAMAEVARVLGWTDLRLPATEAIGDADLDALRTATVGLDTVATELGRALAQLETADTGRLVGPVSAGYDDAVDTLRRRAKIALDTRDLVGFLPGFLGARGERRYLLAVQTLGQPQGVGGEVDLIGELTALDGVMTLTTALTPAGDAFTNATATADSVAAGEALLTAARDAGLGELDGVILVDSMWLADLLHVSGSVDLPGRPLPLNGDQAARFLERDVFEAPDLAAAEQRRARVATAIVESYLSKRPATEAFAEGLAREVAGRHLTILSTRARERKVLARLGAEGRPLTGRSEVAVLWDSAVENHAVVFARRQVVHSVTLLEDGSARVRTVVELQNEAPDEPPSALLGFPLPATVEEPAGVDPVGGWAADVRVLLPPKADQVTAETSIPRETQFVKEDGRRWALGRLTTDPGDSMALTVGYRVPDAMRRSDTYGLVVLPQPSFEPPTVRVRIDAPAGSTIVDASPQLEVGSSSARYVGQPTEPLALWVRIS